MDSVSTYKELLPRLAGQRWSPAKIKRAQYSMSLFVGIFGTSRQFHDVPHHTILVGPRYRELLRTFSIGSAREGLQLYLHRPTASDSSLAPPGCDSFYVLSPVPHLQGGTDGSAAGETYRRAIANHLDATVLPGFEKWLVTSRIMTPLDFRDRLSAPWGAAFGLAPTLRQSAWFRPHNRSEDVQNLFLVGAGTHPGAGVPGVLFFCAGS